MNNNLLFLSDDYKPLEKAKEKVKADDYNPDKEIEMFWDKFGGERGISNAYEIYLRMRGRGANRFVSDMEIDEYIENLMSVLMSYYLKYRRVY